MNITSLNRMEILNKYVQYCVELPRQSRARFTDKVVDAFYALKFDEHLDVKEVKINWCVGGDDFEKDMRHNMQKLFRWLDAYQESKANPAKLFYIEQVIVAAMPEDLRVKYLNEVYMCSGVSVTKKAPSKHEELDINDMVKSLIKEGSEAQQAALNLGNNPTKETLTSAIREISESEAACAEIRQAIVNHYEVPEIKNHRRSFGEPEAVVSTQAHSNTQGVFEL